ncbi:MAG: hypothetical protein KGO05_13410 [Chloroflexota bacterium]|nr:hypothetical protein [Chloroflexota bacterium]
MPQLSTAPRRMAPSGERATRLYALLLRLAPRGFREAYGAEVAQVFRQLYRDAWARAGAWGALACLGAALSDLLAGVTGEYLALCWGMWNRSWAMSRLRSSAILVFCAYIAFVVVGMGFQKSAEDVVKSSVPTAHPGVALAYAVVMGGAVIALLATLAGGLPLAFAALRQALTTRRWGIVALFAVPPISLLVWFGWLWMLQNVIHVGQLSASNPLDQTRLFIYSFVGLFIVAAIVSVLAVSVAIARSEIRPELYRFALTPEIGVALGMLVTIGAIVAWSVQMMTYAPSYLNGADGPVGLQASLGQHVVTDIVLMSVATLIVIAGVARGYTARQATA